MFLHAPPVSIPDNPSESYSWWAVHAETLTPVRISCGAGARITLEIVIATQNPPTVFASHPDAESTPAAIGEEIMREIRAALNPAASLGRTRFVEQAEADLPEYLIVFDVAGEHPAIWRTLDPQLIIPSKDDHILGQPSHWRTIVDLPAFGWEYWWTDCQQAYEKLGPELTQAAARRNAQAMSQPGQTS